MNLAELEARDARVQADDEVLWQELRAKLEDLADPWLKWLLFEQLNNDRGVLQFVTSRNHRTAAAWELMAWIATEGPGSYGLVYVQDDEDGPGQLHDNRVEADYRNVFRVWRILQGQVEELADPFLSPIVPRINPSEFA